MTRMLALALVAAPVPGLPADQPKVQTIELRSFNYTPKAISLFAGKPVTLRFVNRSGGAHDFTARRFFVNARILAGSADGGEVEVKGGQSRSITLIPAAGQYPAHCGHFMHKQLGMTGTIDVR